MNPFLQALHRVFMQRYGGNANNPMASRWIQHMGTIPEAQNPMVQRALGNMLYGGAYNGPAQAAQAQFAAPPGS